MAIWTRATALLLASLLSACATTKDDVLPQGGPTMKQIYERHMDQMGQAASGAAGRPSIRRPSPRKKYLAGFTRAAADEIEQLFPLLPNPQIVLYVFPHLSREGAPVPGYATAFPLYKVDQYAMPGEDYQP